MTRAIVLTVGQKELLIKILENAEAGWQLNVVAYLVGLFKDADAIIVMSLD